MTSDLWCEETFTLDTGHLKCDLKAGHAGPHKDIAPGDAVWWQKELTRKRDE